MKLQFNFETPDFCDNGFPAPFSDTFALFKKAQQNTTEECRLLQSNFLFIGVLIFNDVNFLIMINSRNNPGLQTPYSSFQHLT